MIDSEFCTHRPNMSLQAAKASCPKNLISYGQLHHPWSVWTNATMHIHSIYHRICVLSSISILSSDRERCSTKWKHTRSGVARRPSGVNDIALKQNPAGKLLTNRASAESLPHALPHANRPLDRSLSRRHPMALPGLYSELACLQNWQKILQERLS